VERVRSRGKRKPGEKLTTELPYCHAWFRPLSISWGKKKEKQRRVKRSRCCTGRPTKAPLGEKKQKELRGTAACEKVGTSDGGERTGFFKVNELETE